MEFDYVIVGGGSAGCVLAGRLSADPARRVCLIEAGPPDNNFLCHMPFATALFIPGQVAQLGVRDGAASRLNGRRGYQPRGRMLGGSSGLNAMIYIRGHASDYDDWAAQGARGLVVRRRAALLQARRGQRAPRRRTARQRAARSTLPIRSVPIRSTRCSLLPATSFSFRATTISTGSPGGRGPLSGDAEERRALERGARLSAAGGAAAAEPAHRDRNARASRCTGRPARHRRRVPPRQGATRPLAPGAP